MADYRQVCGNDTLPAPIVSPSPIVEILFVSDMMVVDRGFELQYKVSGKGPFTLTVSEREIDVTFRWVPTKSNLLFISSGDKDKIKKSLSHSPLLSVNKP